MARSRSHRGSRDTNVIASPLRPSWLSPPVYRPIQPVLDLRTFHPSRDLLGPLEVTRSWTPSSYRPAQVVDRRVDRTPVNRTNRFGNPTFAKSSTPAIWAFKSPHRVPVCVRREVRREVIFARGKAGRGYKKPRWTKHSYVRCR